MKKLWQKKWFRRTVYFFISIGLIAVVLLIFHRPILRGMGNYLVAQDPLTETPLFVVLGGDSYDRGLAAIDVGNSFPNATFLTTGGNTPHQLLAFDTAMFEAELTKHFMVAKGIDGNRITAMPGATSTKEEAQQILAFCKEKNLSEVTIISSNYHLRRVRKTMEKVLLDQGIKSFYHARANSDYDPNAWWQSESGLIYTNNEYIKLLYYAIKY